MNHKFAALAMALLGATASQAQEAAVDAPRAPSSSYIAVLAGISDLDKGCNGLSPCDTDGKYTKLYAGSEVFRNVYAEGALMDFGAAKFGSQRANAQALGFTVAYRWNPLKRLSLSARGGMAWVISRVKQDAIAGADEGTGKRLQPLFGVSADVNVYGPVNLVVGADFTRVKLPNGDEHNLQAYGAGIGVKF